MCWIVVESAAQHVDQESVVASQLTSPANIIMAIGGICPLCCCCRDGAACRQFHCPLPQGGGIISQVRDRTGAKVHMCDAEPGRPDRIITISLIDGQR
jgi:hypothetical protein